MNIRILILLIIQGTFFMLVGCAAEPVEEKKPIKTTANLDYSSPTYARSKMWEKDHDLSSEFDPQQHIRVSRIDGVGNYIALTFDDGPEPRNTPRLLDALRARNVKATFYVIGRSVDRYPDIVRRIAEEGHELGNHTYVHPNLAKLSKEKVRKELDLCIDSIVRATGQKPLTLRPPYGSLRKDQRAWINEEYNYPTILWDVDPMDWKDRVASTVKRRILNSTRDGSIVLSHDLHKTTVDAMPETLDELLEKGFHFVTVSQLLAMKKPTYGLASKLE